MNNLKVIFKNVHQGDAIILKWQDNDGNLEMGIIDCSLCKHNTNPILDELKDNPRAKLKFLILTHPHNDHYSGLIEIINYLYQSNRVLDYFIHSCGFSVEKLNLIFSKELNLDEIFEILTRPVFLKSDKNDLEYIYKVLVRHELDEIASQKNKLEKRIINKVVNISSHIWPLKITSFLSLEFKSPIYSVEVKKYLNSLIKDNSKKYIDLGKDNNPNANYLSIISEISFYENKIILSSDAMKVSFLRLKNDVSEYKKIKLYQIPHHGSKYNFRKTYWNHFLKHCENCSFIISAGDKYNHPDREIIELLRTKGETHCTNSVNGFKEIIDTLDLKSQSDENLDKSVEAFFLEDLNVSPHFGHKEFVIEPSGNILCNTYD